MLGGCGNHSGNDGRGRRSSGGVVITNHFIDSSVRSRRSSSGNNGRTTGFRRARSTSLTLASLSDSSSFFSSFGSYSSSNTNDGGNAHQLLRSTSSSCLVEKAARSQSSSDDSSCDIVEPSWFSHAFDNGSGSTCEETLRRAEYVGVVVKQNATNAGDSSNDVTMIDDDIIGAAIDINDECNEVNSKDNSKVKTSNQRIDMDEKKDQEISLVIAVSRQQQQDQSRQQEEMIQQWKVNIEQLEAKCAKVERQLIHEKEENERIRALGEDVKDKFHAESLLQQEQQLKLARLQFDNENIMQELNDWKNKCVQIEKEYNDKCLEDRSSISHSPDKPMKNNKSEYELFSTSSLSTSTVNDELVEQIGNLAVENGRLINENAQLNSRYQVLQQEYQCSLNSNKMDIDNAHMTIKSMEAENNNLRASLTERDKKTAELIRYLQRCSFLCTTYSATSSDILNNDDNDDNDDNDGDVKKEYTTPQTINDTSIELAKHLTGEIHEKLALFLEVHENNVDTKMNALHDKLEQQLSLNDDLSRQLDLLTKEKEQLSTDLEGANNLLLSSVHDEIKWDREREELFTTIIGLKQENEKLHESLCSMSEKKQVERVKVESLSKELELKSSTIHAVQSVLGSMKEEQTKIKETIEYLREENTRLRGQKSSSTLSLDVSLDSSTRQQKISSSSLNATDSSSQTSSLVKENKNLRKAYATLSSKLFDEMEKTDSLRIANEGLATRICKLVALIQKQNNTLDSLDRETTGCDDATTPATGNSNKSSRRRSITAPGKRYP